MTIIIAYMETLLIRYGYALLFLGVAVEGEVFLLAASYLAHRGIFSLPLVILVAVIANCGADQIYYVLARTRGYAWLQKRFGEHPRYQKVVNLMARHGSWLLLGSRYAFGFRIIIPAACGALGMPPLRFTIINILASLVWALPTSLLGFYLGRFAEILFIDIQKYEFWLLCAFAVAATIILLIRHARRAEWIEDLKAADIHTFVPFLIAVMGLINLLSAILPRDPQSMRELRDWLPLEVTQRSRPLMLFAGIALLQVSRNLARRKELAWYVAVAAMSLSLLLHITRAFDLHHSLVAGLLLAYLLYNRRRFYALSDPFSIRLGLLMIPLMAAAVFAYGYIGLADMQNQFTWYPGAAPFNETIRSGILILEPNLDPNTEHAARFLGSLQVAGWLARIYVLVLFLRPVILRRRMEAPSPEIERIFRAHSRHSLSVFAVQGDKHHMLVAGGRGLIAYAIRGSVALTCGDPIVPDELFEPGVNEYLGFCRKNGWTPCFYEAAEVRLPVYQTLGLHTLKMAEEAVLDLREFGLAGNKRANLRAMVNKVAKTGMTVSRYDRLAQPDVAIDEQLEEISQEWLAEKHLGEMGFTIGRFSLETLKGIPVFIAIMADKVVAFCSWSPYRGGQAVVLDLMRKRSDAVAGTMDFLLAHSLLQLQSAGFAEGSLANAPLANVTGPRGSLEKGVALLFENMNSFYGYKNLFQFKKKFAPSWEGRYLVYPKGTDLLRVSYALASVHSSGGLLQLILRR
jgi:phosphatidylglycerol lysyltransferase